MVKQLDRGKCKANMMKRNSFYTVLDVSWVFTMQHIWNNTWRPPDTHYSSRCIYFTWLWPLHVHAFHVRSTAFVIVYGISIKPRIFFILWYFCAMRWGERERKWVEWERSAFMLTINSTFIVFFVFNVSVRLLSWFFSLFHW